MPGYLLAVLAGVVTAIVYLPALGNDFVFMDDNLYVYDNPHLHSIDKDFFLWAFTRFHSANWHPLTWISHAVDVAIWGMNPLGHHLTSIILHGLNTAFVVLLSLRLISAASDLGTAYKAFESGTGIRAAAFVSGILFGLHPLHVESVAWISERKDLLSAFFFLLSILSYLEYAGISMSLSSQRGMIISPSLNPSPQGREISYPSPLGGEGRERGIFETMTGESADKTSALAGRRRRYFAASHCFYLFSLLSKPMAVTLPVVLLLIDWFPLGRTRRERPAALLAEKAVFFLLSIEVVFITLIAQQEAIGSLSSYSITERLFNAGRSSVLYFAKILFPVGLHAYYPYPKNMLWMSFDALVPVLSVVITIVCAMIARRCPHLSAAWGSYMIMLLPVIGLVQVGTQAMADRYTYLPSIGPFLFLAAGAVSMAGNLMSGLRKRRQWMLSAVIFFPFVFLLVVMTVRQAATWRNTETLFLRIIRFEPDVASAHNNLGVYYSEKGELSKAISSLRRAVDLKPEYAEAHMNLGMVLMDAGQMGTARHHLLEAVRLKPDSADAFMNLGIVCGAAGRLEDAINAFKAAIRLAPEHPKAYFNLGYALEASDRNDAAIENYRKALRIDPNYARSHAGLGRLLKVQGRLDKAVSHIEAALRLGEDSAEARYDLAEVYMRKGMREKAEEHLSAYLRLRPGDKGAGERLGLPERD